MKRERILPSYFTPPHATEIKRFNLDGKACSPTFTVNVIHQPLHFSELDEKLNCRQKTETCCSFSSVLFYKCGTFLLHRSDSLPSQSPHLIHSSSPSLICSLSFSHAPSACHSFISLIVSSFVSLTRSKIFLFAKLLLWD